MGLVAAFFWGLYPIMFKISVNSNYFNTPVQVGMIGFSLGVVIVSAVLYLPDLPISLNVEFNKWGFFFSVIAGILWCLGQSAVTNALSHPSTNVSRLVVLYNVNTLITVLGGILLLNEIPESGDRVQIIIGAILIILGGIFSAR